MKIAAETLFRVLVICSLFCFCCAVRQKSGASSTGRDSDSGVGETTSDERYDNNNDQYDYDENVPQKTHFDDDEQPNYQAFSGSFAALNGDHDNRKDDSNNDNNNNTKGYRNAEVSKHNINRRQPQIIGSRSFRFTDYTLPLSFTSLRTTANSSSSTSADYTSSSDNQLRQRSFPIASKSSQRFPPSIEPDTETEEAAQHETAKEGDENDKYERGEDNYRGRDTDTSASVQYESHSEAIGGEIRSDDENSEIVHLTRAFIDERPNVFVYLPSTSIKEVKGGQEEPTEVVYHSPQKSGFVDETKSEADDDSYHTKRSYDTRVLEEPNDSNDGDSAYGGTRRSMILKAIKAAKYSKMYGDSSGYDYYPPPAPIMMPPAPMPIPAPAPPPAFPSPAIRPPSTDTSFIVTQPVVRTREVHYVKEAPVTRTKFVQTVPVTKTYVESVPVTRTKYVEAVPAVPVPEVTVVKEAPVEKTRTIIERVPIRTQYIEPAPQITRIVKSVPITRTRTFVEQLPVKTTYVERVPPPPPRAITVVKSIPVKTTSWIPVPKRYVPAVPAREVTLIKTAEPLPAVKTTYVEKAPVAVTATRTYESSYNPAPPTQVRVIKSVPVVKTTTISVPAPPTFTHVQKSSTTFQAPIPEKTTTITMVYTHFKPAVRTTVHESEHVATEAVRAANSYASSYASSELSPVWVPSRAQKFMVKSALKSKFGWPGKYKTGY